MIAVTLSDSSFTCVYQSVQVRASEHPIVFTLGMIQSKTVTVASVYAFTVTLLVSLL